MAEIRFLKNEASKVEGLAYAGFETFRGSPYRSCARETGQNSRDAAAGNGPVHVCFRLLSIDRAEVPFADALQKSITSCLAAPVDEKTKLHLERAHGTINAPRIKILEISDRNTTGLTGPTTDPTSVFAALVKGDGVTNKSDVTSAGSFGIGKNAAYAVSDLQTVIYTSCYRDSSSEEMKFAAQGRLRLISHTDGVNKFSAEGYWGNADFSAIEDKSGVPSWLSRDEIGTSIFSVGFRETENWDGRITLSLVTNFFLAIDRNEIEFMVGESKRINKASLDSVLASPELQQIATEADESDELKRARLLVECTRSDAATKHTISVPGLGDFTLSLLVEKDLPREVHVLRNGIYIADNFSKFAEPMKRFPATQEFIAVLEPAQTPAGYKPSSLLKQLENPAHDSFEPERIIDKQERDAARRAIKNLIKQVRLIIRSVAKIDDTHHSQLNELSHLFAESASAHGTGVGSDEKDPESFKYGTAHKGNRKRNTGTPGAGAGTGTGTGAKKSETTKPEGGSRGPRPGLRTAMPLQAIRSRLTDQKDARKRRIFFTPDSDGEIELTIAAFGLKEDVMLTIADASVGNVLNGRIRTSAKAGQRIVVDLTFAEPFGGPIELSACALAPTSVHEVT